MVSSIVPGATSAGALAVDPRYTRAVAQPDANAEKSAAGDRVEVSGPVAWAAARESVGSVLAQVQLALGVARDAQTMLLKVQSLTSDEGSSQADLVSVLTDYTARFEEAAKQGGALVSGKSLSIQAEPGGVPLTIAGADLALKGAPAAGDTIQVARDASLADRASLSQSVQRSLDRLQSVMEQFGDAQRALEAHQGFLGAAQIAASNVTDLDADGARLLALQVRQGLEAVGARPIANVGPQAVLALFKV